MITYILQKTLSPFNRFLHYEHSGGLVLLISVILALLLANSSLSEGFHHLWETKLGVSFNGEDYLNYSLHQWINDGLMAMFFFVVGLELKREILIGELSSIKKAILPIGAAIGGMIVPALIYTFFNINLPSEGGWGIPMATDIVFSLAFLGLVGRKVPFSAKIFLVALATVDDIGAVLVIALFYSSQLSILNLAIGFVLLTVLLIANLLGVRNLIFYAIVGIGGVWLAFLLSGVHATIAGVLVAFTIPAKTKLDETVFSETINKLIARFKTEIPKEGPLVTPEQNQIIEEIRMSSADAQSPLQKLEYKLHPWVTFVIIPLFALSNAGVIVNTDFFNDLDNPVTVGVIAGLVVGKFIGVSIFIFSMVKLKLAKLPVHTTWTHMIGIAMLAGVGFTMSLFITDLAFDNSEMISQAKYGILLASLVSGISGVIILKRM